MIVDSSALIAVTGSETGWEALRDALFEALPVVIPAPALVEVRVVLAGRRIEYRPAFERLLAILIARGITIEEFSPLHAELCRRARDRYGKGNGRGGLLNFGDLMVYAVAKDLRRPLLCTGRDFASTDLELHPASRLD